LCPETTGDAVSDFSKWLDHEYWNIRREAAISLGKIGPGAKAAIPALKKALRDADQDVRDAAVEALTAIEWRWWRNVGR
jgi:HEAT repeat protein